MKRRAPKLPTKNPPAPHSHSANHCRAIVLVDSSHIRKKFQKDYEKALRDLDNSRRQLDQFQQTDLPEFTRWLNTHFGALLTEIRELSQKLAADEELAFHVQSLAMFEGCSFARAYQRVMELRENPEPPPDPPASGGEPDGDRDPFGAGPDDGRFDPGEDPLEDFFNQFFGGSGPGERPPGQGGSRAHHHKSAAPPHASARLKDLYRRLVRQLHPDTQREMTAQKLEWWHQTQTAYEAGDVEQLEVILTLCEIEDCGTTAHTSASLLQRITAKVKSSLREIKRQIAARRHDPAWNFSRRPDHDVLAIRMRRDFTEDLKEMRAQWRQTQELIAEWKAAAERLKSPRRRKRQPQRTEFLF